MLDQKSLSISQTWKKFLPKIVELLVGFSHSSSQIVPGRARDSDGDFLSGRHLSCRPISSPDKVEELN